MDNWEWDREAILETGIVRYPTRPDTLYRQVAVADIAAMVVAAFEHPDVWTGQIMSLAGDVSSMDEITATPSRVLGRALHYGQISWEQCVAEQAEGVMLVYRDFDTFGMDGGAPTDMHRFHSGAMNFEACLRDADFVNVVGFRWRNRRAIRKAHDYGFRRIFQNARVEITEVKVLRELTPDIHLVHPVSTLDGRTGIDGSAPGQRIAAISMVTRRGAAGFEIVSCRNTDRVDGADTHVRDSEGVKPASYRG